MNGILDVFVELRKFTGYVAALPQNGRIHVAAAFTAWRTRTPSFYGCVAIFVLFGTGAYCRQLNF